MSETIDRDRRRMVGATLITLATAEVLAARPANAQAAKRGRAARSVH